MTTNIKTYCTLFVSSIKEGHEAESELNRLSQELIDPDDNCPLSFFNHVPVPQILIDNCYKSGDAIESENEKSTGYKFLHQFTKGEWGTPFDATDVNVSSDQTNHLEYTFNTIDGIPMQWLEQLSVAFPTLMFEIECENEMELWDSFSATYIDGDEVDHYFHKKQK